jgi:hypothetical protein
MNFLCNNKFCHVTIFLLCLLLKGLVFLVEETHENCGYVWKYIRLHVGSRPAVTHFFFVPFYTFYYISVFSRPFLSD